MKNELFKLYNQIIKGEKIKIILSNNLEVYIDSRDALDRNSENIVIVSDNGVRTVLNPEHVVMVSLIIPRKWLWWIENQQGFHKQLSWQDYLLEYSNVFYVLACLFVSIIIVLLFIFACAYFNVSFTESGMIRNFLMGGV